MADLNQLGFKIAFAVENYNEKFELHDPNYVEWKVSMKSNKNGTVTTHATINTHLCTDDDFNGFYKPAGSIKAQF